MDIEEFRKDQRRKYAEAIERQERLWRRRRRWMYASLIVLAAVVLALVALRLMR